MRDFNRDVWSLRVADGTVSRLTFDVATDFYPTCAPAADDLVFTSTRTGGTPTLHRLSLSAPGNERALHEFRAPSLPTQWTPDGRFIFYSAFFAATNWDIWIQPVDGGEPFSYLATAEEEKNAQLSPDGRWVAYTSGRNGVFEVYVQAFPQAGARWQVSSGGGRQPQWTANGKLLYVALDSRLMVVNVEPTADGFNHSAARVLGDTRIASGVERTYHGNSYAVQADGERLLIAHPVEQTLSVTLLENWPALGP
jgi:Tol biopolymer transport system component